MYCTYCGSNFHTVQNCPKTWNGQGNRNKMRCSYCGSRTHNISACPKTWNGNANRSWHEDVISNDFIRDGRTYEK